MPVKTTQETTQEMMFKSSEKGSEITLSLTLEDPQIIAVAVPTPKPTSNFMPKWRLYRDELNALPVRHEDWQY